ALEERGIRRHSNRACKSSSAILLASVQPIIQPPFVCGCACTTRPTNVCVRLCVFFSNSMTSSVPGSKRRVRTRPILPLDRSRTGAGQGSSLTAATERQNASKPVGRRDGARPSIFEVPWELGLFLLDFPAPAFAFFFGLTRQPSHCRHRVKRLARRGM